MIGLASDLHLAVRSLRRRPGFTLTVVAVLALGLGAATAVFALVYDVLLRPLPYPRPGEVVAVHWTTEGQTGTEGRVSAADVEDLRAASRSFAQLAVVSDETFVLSGGERPERVAGARVDGDFFPLLALPPRAGRLPRTDDPPAAVVTESLAERRFGGRLAALDRDLRIDGRAWRVAAVVPDGLDLPPKAEIWLPLEPPEEDPGRAARYLLAYGRLAPGVSVAQANQELGALSQRLAEEHPETNAGTRAEIVPLHEEITAPVRPALRLLLIAVGFLLLVVIANSAAMVLARVASRAPELGVRLALGTSRARLLRAVAAESAVLAFAGALVGLLVAAWSGRMLVAFFPLDLPRVAGFHLAALPVAVHFAAALAAGLVLALVPGLHAALRSTVDSLPASGGRRAGDRRTGRLMGWILVPQVAVTLVLLVGAALLVGSLAAQLRVDPGFRTAGRLSARLMLPSYAYPDEDRRAAFFASLLDRLRADPSVAAAGAVTNLPLSGSNMLFPVHPADGAEPQPVMANYRAATPGYFATLGIPVRGRAFGPGDRAGSPPVALVNETLARKLWSGDALGHKLVVGFGEPVERAVVGVVADVHHFGLTEPPRPEVYVPHAQAPWPFLTVVLEARHGPPKSLAPVVRAAVADLDPDLPLDRVEPLPAVVSDTVARPRFYGALAAAFGLLALLVAAVGIYGLTAFAVRLRSAEIGVRMTLGATRGQIFRLFLRRPLRLALLGVVLGTAGAVLFARALAGLLFRLTPTEPWIYAAAALVLVLTAALAGGLPARQAARLDAREVLARE